MANKKRGRPKGSKNKKNTTSKKPADNTPKKRRGRPKKSTFTRDTPFDEQWQQALKISDHIPSKYALTMEERKLSLLAALACPDGAHLVELGIYNGKTAAVLMHAASVIGGSYTGIDHFGLPESSITKTKKYLDKTGLKYNIIESYTGGVDWPGDPVDLVLFDAGHDELNMRHDVALWIPRIKPGGLALFHAYSIDATFEDPHFPVKKYADEYTRNWTHIEYIPSLLVRQRPL